MAKRRRGRGEGSIYQRSDGRWCGALTTGADENGKLKRRVVYGRTRRDVADKLARLNADSITGTLTEPNRITVGEYLNRWLRDDVAQSRRSSTAEGYELIVRKHINPHLGGLHMQKLTPVHVQAWLAELERGGLPQGRRNRVYLVLRVALKQAVRLQLIHTDPTNGVTPPKNPTREIRPLSVEEVERLLECARGERYEALFVLAVGTGLRWGELAGLRWGDLDVQGGSLQVQRIVTEVKGKIVIHDPKTKSGRRRVPIPRFAVEALAAHRAKQAADPHPTAWVFGNRTGGPLRRGNFHAEHWRPLRERAGIPTARIHDLRHTTASMLVRRGVHAKVVQSILGHARFGITMDLYSHLMDGMHEEAAEALDGLLGTA